MGLITAISLSSMEPLQSQDFNQILSILTIINSSLDKDVYHQRLLDSLLKSFRMENSISPLADEKSKLTDFQGINIEEKYIKDFLNYYHLYDSFNLIQGPLKP